MDTDWCLTCDRHTVSSFSPFCFYPFSPFTGGKWPLLLIQLQTFGWARRRREQFCCYNSLGCCNSSWTSRNPSWTTFFPSPFIVLFHLFILQLYLPTAPALASTSTRTTHPLHVHSNSSSSPVPNNSHSNTPQTTRFSLYSHSIRIQEYRQCLLPVSRH